MSLLVLLAGCYLTVEEVQSKLDEPLPEEPDTDTGEEEEEDLGPIQITGIEPAYGSSAGGYEVEITVGPLSREVEVRIGGIVAEILEEDVDRVVIEAPPSSVGRKDVTVSAGSHADTLGNGFRYYADANGGYELVGALAWYTFPGPDRDGSPMSARGDLWIGVVQPQGAGWDAYWLGASLDQCTFNHARPGLPERSLGVPQLELKRSGAASIVAAYQALDELYETPITASQWASDASYDLSPVDSDAWPAFTLEGLVRTPDPLSLTGPNLGSTFPPLIPQTVPLRWSATSGERADYVAVRILRYNATIFGTPEVQDVVTCKAVDDGMFDVPATAWLGGWDTGGDLWIEVGRVRTSDVRLPHDDARTSVVGVSWVAGWGLQSF